MIVKVVKRNIYIHNWDWKETPSWNQISKCIDHINDKPHFYEIDTGSDEYAVIISDTELNNDEVCEIQSAYRSGDEEIIFYDPF